MPDRNYFLLALLILIFSNLDAQVVINEFSASNLHQFEDNYGKTEDWVELYNASSQAIDISGWYLSDKSSKKKKWQFPQGVIIDGESFLIVWCSGRDEFSSSDIHTNFKLSQTTGKDKILLTDDQGNLLEEYKLNITQVGHSICRKFDGSIAWRICTQPTPGDSNNDAEQFNAYTAKPSMDKEAGFYEESTMVSITNNEENSVLRFTLDGSIVTEESPIYEAPIEIQETTVIKARSFSNDPLILPGLIEFNTYFIDEEFSVTVFSVASEEVIELADGDGSKIPIGSIEYFNLNNEREATSYGSLNRHGKDSWILPHRSIDWVSRDEMGYSKAVFAELFSYSDRDEYQKFMFRNSGDDNYPANDDNAHKGSTHIRDEYVQTLASEGNMRLDTRAVERVVLFLNGQYWGLYGMRDRPVDHDYTDYYYDQDKYNLHYLSTWGTTEAQYGGVDAFNEWYLLRDFVLENDMSIPENYDYLINEMDLLSFSDYFIANLSVVAKDWLNWNTGWWKGLDEDGMHKKWGYILWDLDATFDYYINYTGVPNVNPDARPCDIEIISLNMDNFFGNAGNPENCNTIVEMTSPYPADDSIFVEVISQDAYCCNTNWDDICQGLYDDVQASWELIQSGCNSIDSGSSPYLADDPFFQQTIQESPTCCTEEWDDSCEELYHEFKVLGGEKAVSGNVGKHEKLLLKLLEESADFRELYYQRFADMMNTVYTCENMIETLERMLAVIEPEMPRQIERWGGSMEEWEENVESLKDFVNQRCMLIDEGMVSCYDLSGPYEITLITDPPSMASIGLNTIELETLPWTGSYFGNMKNQVNCKLLDEFESEYVFSHWESLSGSTIIEDIMEQETDIELMENDTLVAYFKLSTGLEETLSDPSFSVFPNPSSDQIFIDFSTLDSEVIELDLFSINGQKMLDIKSNAFFQGSGMKISLKKHRIPTGVYQVRLKTSMGSYTKKIVLI